MNAGRGQRRLVPNFQHFTETSYPEPGVVPVAGVYVWSVDAVADGGGSWETLTVLVHSSDNLTVMARLEARHV